MRILIVEDDPDILSSLSRVMDDRGFSVRATSDGQQALEILGEEGTDLVLTDVQLPKLDGLDLLQLVRIRFPGVPVVLLTGHGDRYAVPALQRGAFDYLKKPVSVKELLACVNRIKERLELERGLLKKSRQLLWPQKTAES